MSILGIDQITYGVEDPATCRQFFLDWGLTLKRESADRLEFECLNGCGVIVARSDDAALPPAMETGPTVREVVWGVASPSNVKTIAAKLAGAPGFFETENSMGGETGAIDPNGLGLRIRVTQKRAIDVQGVPMNTWGNAQRIDTRSRVYERAEPVEVGHVVFFTAALKDVEAFYCERLGFAVSDRYPGRGLFLRCAPHGGHHDVFFLQLPTGKRGLNHVAFAVRDIHEVFGGGLHFSKCGWETDLGPGRHPISSAYFWYFKSPGGGLVEYYTDEDMLTPAWKPREFESKPENFAEWAILGGIDGVSRRQKQGPAPGAQTLAGQAARKPD